MSRWHVAGAALGMALGAAALLAVDGLGAETAPPALLFIVTGQSNAGNNGRAAELGPAERAAVDGAWLYSPQTTKSRQLVPMEPVRGTFGVELSLARAVRAACPGREVVVVKVHSGGTSIIAWDPGAPGRAGWQTDMARVGNSDKPAMYPKVAQLAREARALKAAELAGVLYVQTERDSKYIYGAARYEGNLRRLIAAWRREWDAPGLPVVFMDSHTNLSGGGTAVHNAVVSVAEDVAGTAWVASRDLPKKGDRVHFNSAGLWALGERMAAAWLRLAGGCE